MSIGSGMLVELRRCLVRGMLVLFEINNPTAVLTTESYEKLTNPYVKSWARIVI